MKEFTAIYSTEFLKGAQYSFKADGVKEAIRFASQKFLQFPNIAIVSNEDEGESADYGRLVFLNGSVVNGTYDVVFNDEDDSNNVGVNGTYSECMQWIENHRADKTSYFGDYAGGKVSIYCDELEEYVYTENINNKKNGIMETKNVKNLDQLAEYINQHEDWLIEVNEIIERNGWVDETGSDYGICNDGIYRLSFDSDMKAVVSLM